MDALPSAPIAAAIRFALPSARIRRLPDTAPFVPVKRQRACAQRKASTLVPGGVGANNSAEYARQLAWTTHPHSKVWPRSAARETPFGPARHCQTYQNRTRQVRMTLIARIGLRHSLSRCPRHEVLIVLPDFYASSTAPPGSSVTGNRQAASKPWSFPDPFNARWQRACHEGARARSLYSSAEAQYGSRPASPCQPLEPRS